MQSAAFSSRLGAVALLLLASASATTAPAMSREQCRSEFAPRTGEAGKDVIWLPTLDEVVTEMLTAADVTAKDYVIDLGAGDGKIPIAAARQFGARALGIEYNPQLVKLAQCYVQAEGLADKVQIREADIFATDFSKATVLTLYLLSDLNLKLRPTILGMKPGTRVVSNTFRMGDWEPDRLIESEMGNTRAYLWIVPAKVEGTWTFREEGGSDAFRLVLKQRLQEIQGAVPKDSPAALVQDARLRGAAIEFTLVGHGDQPLAFRGTVEQDRILASAQRGGKRLSYIGMRL